MGEVHFPWQEPVLAALIELNTEKLDAKVGAPAQRDRGAEGRTSREP
jgi:hypothetical protein